MDWLAPTVSTGKFVWGMIGAAAPEIMRLNRIVTGGLRQPLPVFNPGYFIISFANAIIGGFVAMAFGENTQANCFIVGAFWPLLITSFARQFRR